MMNENPEQTGNKEEKRPKPKDPRRVAAGKRGAEARTRNAELRKKETEKLIKENLKIKQSNDTPQITKDFETDEPKETCLPPAEKHSGYPVDYKFALFSLGIVGLGWYIYSQSKKTERILLGKEEPKKQKKEIDPFEFA